MVAQNAYNMPSVKALIRFLHAADGFRVNSTWLASIKDKNYAKCPGLTYENAKTYHPTAAETLKVHMTQIHQDVRSTKRKIAPSNPTRSVSPLFSDIPATTSNELYVVVDPISKLYTNDMGQFPIRSRSGNRYIMLVFHFDSKVILIEPFQYLHDRHRIAAYIRIMVRHQERGYAVDLQILYNEASN